MQKPLELTKTQQRHTLSAKKKKQQPSLKNVLAQPFPRYWPQIDVDESKELFELLNEVKTLNPNQFAHKKSDTSSYQITYGLSSTLRKIKNGRVRILIVSADLKPRYVINQIILLALARNEATKILCVPNLENEMKTLVDFQCFAFAINDNESSEYRKLFEWCEIVTTERYPVPTLIRTYFNTRRRTTDTEIESIPMDTDSGSAQCSRCNEIPLSDLYLIRSCTEPKQRAFIPKNAINLKPLSFDVMSLDKIKSDFISLDTFDSDDNTNKNIDSLQSPSIVSTSGENKSAKYKPMHVKEAMKGDQRYQPAKIKRYAGNALKKKNDGKAKLTREQRKEMRKARKKAKKEAKKNK